MGRRCSLCDGKLDSNRICRECGLDNKKTDANYVINKSSCDDKPLTHVHEEKASRREKAVKSKKESSYQTFQNTYSSGNKYVRKDNSGKGKRVVSRAAIIVIIISILGELLSVVPDIFDNMGGLGFEEITSVFEEEIAPEPEYYSESYDPYQWVTREIPAEGSEYSTTLGQGQYVVGYHIPEGIYTCIADEGYVSIDVSDVENEIWIYEWIDEEQTQIDDIRLYEGAVVEVFGDTPLIMMTSNAQDGMIFNPNPLEDAKHRILNGATAGVDFEPGVYDLYVDEGYGQIIVDIPDATGEVTQWKYIWLDSDFEMESTYVNLVLPEGAVINWDAQEYIRVWITASPQIKDEDYFGYYEY